MSKAATKISAGDLALCFAKDLVAGKYEKAHGMLSIATQAEISSGSLKQDYESMISYFPETPDLVEVLGEKDEWPAQELEDVAWVYVSIASSAGYGEAVTVVVSCENDSKVIRDIEWGRP